MASFGKRSTEKLSTAHPLLQEVFNEVVKHFNCSILEGHRDQDKQNSYFTSKPQKSKVEWPNSKHNSMPAMAVDAIPYYAHRDPHTDWEELREFSIFAGFVIAIAKTKGIQIIWGGNWKGDWDIKENSFFDGPHFQLVSEEKLQIISNPKHDEMINVLSNRIETYKQENEMFRGRLIKIINTAQGE